jgi:hypothetical protein
VIAALLTIMAVTLGKVPLTLGQITQLFLVDTLGALPFCAIGMFMGSLVSGQASPAIINFVFLPMAFLSGLFVPLYVMPKILQTLAPVWPAFHLSQMSLAIVGKPSQGSFAGHVAVLAGLTLLFFLLAVKRMHGNGFRLLGTNPKRALVLAAGAAAVIIGLSLSGVFGGKPANTEDANAATDAASAATGTPASAATSAPATPDLPAAEPAPPIALLADFDQGSMSTAYGNGMLAGGDENQNGKSTATQKLVDGAHGSQGALEVTGEVRPGAQYPTAGTFFFPTGEIMKASLDISAKKALSFQARGDGKPYTLMIFTAGSYIPIMQPFRTGPEWQEVKLDLSRYVGADFKHVRGFGMVSMAMGAFQFQIDDLRLE